MNTNLAPAGEGLPDYNTPPPDYSYTDPSILERSPEEAELAYAAMHKRYEDLLRGEVIQPAVDEFMRRLGKPMHPEHAAHIVGSFPTERILELAGVRIDNSF